MHVYGYGWVLDFLLMELERITITIDGEEGRLTPRAFMVVLRATVDLLEEIHRSEAAAQELMNGSVRWAIEDLEKTNPGVVKLVADADLGIVAYAIDGLQTLNDRAEHPVRLSYKALRYAKKIVGPISRGVKSIELRNGSKSVSPTQHVAANVDRVLGNRYYVADTSLEGRLNVIDIRGKLKITVEDEATGTDVVCRCPPELLENVRQYLNGRVSIAGEVKYDRKSDRPVSIAVQDVTQIQQGSVPFDNMSRIDITGGSPSEDYIRRLRNGN